MNINCINDCVYQFDGKCTLTKPTKKQLNINFNNNTCPYMLKKTKNLN